LIDVKVDKRRVSCNEKMNATTSPALSDIDFELVRRQMLGAKGFPHFCIDGFLDEAFAAEVHDAFPSYADAERIGHSFTAVNEKRKTQITDAGLFPPPIRRLHELLASDAFVERMSYISGIANLVADPALIGGGIHETNHGGHLDVHVDFNVNERTGLYRRLNILVYFNKDWKEEYGGYLDLWDEEVRRCLGRFAPTFNRAAGFATSATSWHGVTPVACPPGQMRRSFAAYYYTEEPPPGWDGIKRSTVFRARPDERWKRQVAMPVEGLMHATRDKVATVKRKIQKTFSG
jgi:Rps23 Pro-64 3,4-dihydroxylase Tpa1-like proline 4-hydroxylase